MQNSYEDEIYCPLDKSKDRPESKRHPPLLWILPFVTLLLLSVAGFLFFRVNYIVIDNIVLRRNSTALDLRNKTVSVETHDKIASQFPDAVIRWGIPLGSFHYDNDAYEITLSDWSDESLDNLKLFSHLQSIDATDANLTAEQVRKIQAASPDANIRWSVPLGGKIFPSDAAELTLSNFDISELDSFSYFTSLSQIDATSCSCYDAILALYQAYPDVKILWNVSLGGNIYAQDTSAVELDGDTTSADELLTNLQYLPSLISVSVSGDYLSPEEQDAIIERYPDISFAWQTSLLGQTYSSGIDTLSFAGKTLSEADIAELVKKLPRFSALRQLDLTECSLTSEQFCSIAGSCPNTDIFCSFDLYGVSIDSQDTFIDFTGIPMDSTDAVDAVISRMHHLEKVDMSYTGFDDETMDAMNKRHENVRVVWTMDLCDYYHVRTDDLGFIGTFYYYGYLTPESIQRFKYCEDMICMDLGHRVTFDDLSVLYEMPQLQYLLLADCWTTDFTPVGSLENLIYLEMIIAQVRDLTPLLNCKNLNDLNISGCYYMDKETTYNVLSQMTWLERLYYSYGQLPDGKDADLATALPNTEVQATYRGVEYTGYTWRYNKRYYDMRDLLNAWYMGPYGGRQFTKWIDGVEYEIDPEILAKQRTADDIQGRH